MHGRHVACEVAEVSDRLRASLVGALLPLADEPAVAFADEVIVVVLPQVLPDPRHAQ